MNRAARYGYNPSRAGDNLLKFCAEARKTLTDRLVKPAVTDADAFEVWLRAKAAIRSMDHNELRAALGAHLEGRSGVLPIDSQGGHCD